MAFFCGTLPFVLQENVPLAPKTTLGVGGSAAFFMAPDRRERVLKALEWAQAQHLPVFVLGGGSNVVVADEGWPGLVLTPALCSIDGLQVGAGHSWDRFVDHCTHAGLAGVECLAGIPGTVGATPIQNVGAYGQEVADTIQSVTALHRTTGELRTFHHAECQFGYRQSRFNTTELGQWLLLEVTFALQAGAPPALRYRDLQQHFGPRATPTLPEVAQAVRQIRAQKGMVVDPSDPASRSAGSFFKNPTLSAAQAALLPESAPRFPQADGRVKIPAAWLIEHADLQKGQSLGGGVSLSPKHVLALINTGTATAGAVVQAACAVQKQVEARWGITLHPEPLFVGFPPAASLPIGATRIDAH